MPVQVHRERAVMGIWHRILAINIAGAHVPAVVEIPRHTELEHPTWLPIQHHRRVCPHGARGVDSDLNSGYKHSRRSRASRGRNTASHRTRTSNLAANPAPPACLSAWRAGG